VRSRVSVPVATDATAHVERRSGKGGDDCGIWRHAGVLKLCKHTKRSTWLSALGSSARARMQGREVGVRMRARARAARDGAPAEEDIADRRASLEVVIVGDDSPTTAT